MKYVTKIINRFGGVRATADLLGFPATTVQSWKGTGRIPAKHQARVLAVGRLLDPPLTPADFFDSAPDKTVPGAVSGKNVVAA